MMKKAEKAELISIVCSIFMAAAMLLAARLSGSVGILAEGIDTVVDVVASLAVLVGMKLSERHTSSFPQGLHKLENVIAVAIGILVLMSAWELAKESLERIFEGGRPIEQPWLVIGVMGGVVLITGVLAWYKNKIGTLENSPSLKADAKHSWTDVLASAAVVAGVCFQMIGIPHTDAIAALIVVAALAWSGIGIVLDGLRVLLDASIEKEIIDQVWQYAGGIPGVKRIARVDGRNSGSYRFIKISFVPDSADLNVADEIALNVKNAIRDELEHVDRVDVEFLMEPQDTITWAAPLTHDGGRLSEDFGAAPMLGFFEVGLSRGKIIREDIVSNPVEGKEEGRDIWAAVVLVKRGVNALLTRSESFLTTGAGYVLEANGIETVQTTEVRNMDEAREYLVKYPLKRSA
ncbi:MAG TPA: cation diffusion facilitator family transporter [Syntrophorhabdaceae bacterium]|nr:cation diffusion facilitator family transporter [Syntrophorhabdaceae bacterium]